MKVMTVRPPWAQAIFDGKDVENRSRNIAGDYRGPVAILAGKQLAKLTPAQDALLETVESLQGWFEGEDIVGGAIIGVVDLVDVHHAGDCVYVGPVIEDFDGEFVSQEVTHCSRWAEDANVYHLVLTNARPIEPPIPSKGALGLRVLDEATCIAVWEAIA